MNIKPIRDQLEEDLQDAVGKGIMTGDPVVRVDLAAQAAVNAISLALRLERERTDKPPTALQLASLAIPLVAQLESWDRDEILAAIDAAFNTWQGAQAMFVAMQIGDTDEADTDSTANSDRQMQDPS